MRGTLLVVFIAVSFARGRRARLFFLSLEKGRAVQGKVYGSTNCNNSVVIILNFRKVLQMLLAVTVKLPVNLLFQKQTVETTKNVNFGKAQGFYTGIFHPVAKNRANTKFYLLKKQKWRIKMKIGLKFSKKDIDKTIGRFVSSPCQQTAPPIVISY